MAQPESLFEAEQRDALLAFVQREWEVEQTADVVSGFLVYDEDPCPTCGEVGCFEERHFEDEPADYEFGESL